MAFILRDEIDVGRRQSRAAELNDGGDGDVDNRQLSQAFRAEPARDDDSGSDTVDRHQQTRRDCPCDVN